MLNKKEKLVKSIEGLLKEMSGLEREKKENRICHELSSVKPITIKRDKEKKDLDALAQLLNNKSEKCVALSYVKEKLLIVNNDEKVKECAKKHLEVLGKYIKSPFKQQYENLLIPSIIEFLRRVEYIYSL